MVSPDNIEPQLIGYFAKKKALRPDWLKAPSVEQICSVAECISSGPEGWIDRWEHNDMWVYDTPKWALKAVPQGECALYDLYAYKLFPVRFVEGKQEPFEIPKVHPRKLTPSFEKLGFDVVSRYADNAFGCSPLSCNHRAEDVAVTKHCLITDMGTAFRLGMELEAGGAEPGPYFVVEVWRQKSISTPPLTPRANAT